MTRGPYGIPNGNAKARMVKQMIIPRFLDECWIWMGPNLRYARRRVFVLWYGRGAEGPIVNQPDCHPECVCWAHLSVKAVDTGIPGVKGGE
jgi:hypothetical protein